MESVSVVVRSYVREVLARIHCVAVIILTESDPPRIWRGGSDLGEYKSHVSTKPERFSTHNGWPKLLLLLRDFKLKY